MGQRPTKAADNMYCRCRTDAADRGYDKLRSREGAAEALGVSPSTIADWELNKLKTRPPVEAVMHMADVYHTPELLNHYCTSACPIGRRCFQRIEAKELDRTILEIVGSLRKGDDIGDDLLEIMEDGVISPEERVRLEGHINTLRITKQRIEELELAVKKRLGEEEP